MHHTNQVDTYSNRFSFGDANDQGHDRYYKITNLYNNFGYRGGGGQFLLF